MKDIFIIERSFLIRSALHKLIAENFDHYRIHEMMSVREFMSFKGSRNNAVIIINECLSTEKDEKDLARLILQESCIVRISCNKVTGIKSKEVIFIDEEPFSILAKLKKLIETGPEPKIRGSSTKILSGRQTDILKYVALGLTNREIADKLFLSAHTVITHRKNISAKLGIKTIAGFTVYALLNKIILPSDIGFN
ncbi:MAG: helix-turn-helix transcriptional regulator [Bacteroidales bacterium]